MPYFALSLYVAANILALVISIKARSWPCGRWS